jgi:hypothetical protein
MASKTFCDGCAREIQGEVWADIYCAHLCDNKDGRDSSEVDLCKECYEKWRRIMAQFKFIQI